MKNFLNLLKKDIKEIVTPQLLVPLILVVVFYSFIGGVAQSENKKAALPKPVIVVNHDLTDYSKQFIENLKSVSIPEVYKESNLTPIEYAKSKGIDIIVEIPSNFGESLKTFKQPEIKIYSILKGSSIFTTINSSKISSIIASMNEVLSTMYIKNFTNVDPTFIKNPISLKEYVVINGKTSEVSPSVVVNLLMSQTIFIPIILAFVIIFASQMIAGLIASEKENKTFETLMTVPIKRPLIILSKMIASSIVGVIISIFYMIGMRNYFNGVSMGEFSSSQSVNILKELGLVYEPKQYLFLGILVFLAIVASLGIASILAVFAEDTKSAQMYLTPLMILIMIPYFLSFFTNIDTLSMPLRILVYLIPFSYPFLASQKLLFNDFQVFYIGVVYLTLFSLATVVVAAKIISSDRIFTQKVRKTVKLFGR